MSATSTGIHASGTASRHEDLVGAAQGIAPRIRELAPLIEQERKLPDEAVRLLSDAGVFHMLLPATYGGRQVDPVTAARVVEEIAAADGSAGWCVMIANQHGALSGFIEPEAVRGVFDAGGIMAGTARPVGRALATDTPEPGYVVSGRWPFASGSSHASWFATESVVYDGDSPRKDSGGNDVTRVLIVPRSEVRIIDTWNTTGLRGTASNDFVVEGAFVPEGRGFQMLVSPAVSQWALYLAVPLFFINHGAQALGVARAAIEAATELARTKIGYGDLPLRENPRIQAIIADATALRESAAEYLYGVSQRLWDTVLSGGEPDPVLRSRVRLANNHAVRASAQAVDLVHAAMGTTSLFATSPLERHFRDIHTAAAHVIVGQLVYEAAGRAELGLEPRFPFF